ncbi:MAG: hypothetical protein ACI4PM_06935 [Butyricicoccus sp.]
MKGTIAKILRIITVPPVLVTALVLLLTRQNENDLVFARSSEMLLAVVLLGIVPVLAYPAAAVFPQVFGDHREGQRTAAFVFSLIGYTLAMMLGYILSVGDNLQLVFNTYFLSVVFLTVCNKGLHLRASGHMCSVTGPLIFLMYFTGWTAVIPCVVLGIAVAWSSLYLKRHTVCDLLMGAVVCLLAFLCAKGLQLAVL